MYAEKRFDVLAPPTHVLDDFIDYLQANIEKTYVYNNGGDCLNCRYQTAKGRTYSPPGTASKWAKPSSCTPLRLIETIAADAAPFFRMGLDRVGTYREALKLAIHIRDTDTWLDDWNW